MIGERGPTEMKHHKFCAEADGEVDGLKGVAECSVAFFGVGRGELIAVG